MPRRSKTYHFIYKTTCLKTGKLYVGMHSTDDIDDGYLGSGKILGYSRAKHGDENHVREIIEFLPTREALKLREKEIVNEALLANPLNMNLKYGGEGGFDHVIANRLNLESPAFRQYLESGRLSENARAALKRRKTPQSVTTKKAWQNCRESMLSASKVGLAAMQTDSARSKRKATMSLRQHSVGEKNSQYGTRWVCNKDGALKIKAVEVDDYLLKGYQLGRKSTGM